MSAGDPQAGPYPPPRCRRARSASRRSPRIPWEDEHEVNAFVRRAVRRSWPRAGTGCSCSRRRARPSSVRDSRRLLRDAAREDPERCSRPTAACACSASASCCRSAAATARSSRRRRSTSRARSRRRSCRPRRPRARPRAVRAVGELGRPAPLARAQRRHVPRADRARALDPGRAPLRRALLRPARRAHRLLLRHARPHAARTSRPTTGSSGPARRAARAPERPPGAPVRLAFVDEEERAALRLFLRALRRLPRVARVVRDRLHAERRRARRRAAQPAARARGRLLRHRRAAPRRSSRDADVLVARLARAGAGARAARARARRRRASRSPRGWRSTRRSSSEGDRGLLFEPGDV